MQTTNKTEMVHLESPQREHPCNTSSVVKGNIVTNLEATTVSPFNYLHPFLLNVNCKNVKS